MQKRILKYHLLIALFAIAVIFSALLSFVPISKLCDTGAGVESNCSKVLTSSYSKTFGISNSYIGLGIFSAILILTIIQMKKPSKQKESLLNFGIFVTSIFAVYLIYIQLFVIGQICKYCMIVDVSSVFSLIALIWFGSD